MNKTTSLTLALLIPLLLGAVLLTLLDVTQTNAAPQNVIVVDTLIDENDGSCADGDCSLRDAIATAQIEDTINFSVNGTIDIATLGQLTINNRLTINGGNAITITGNNATRLFKITGGAVTFDGLTLTNGFPTTADCSTGSQICGGALSIESGTAVTITNSLIQDNQADRGGAIYAFFSAVHIDNSTFRNNSSDDLGGAIMMNFFGEIIIADSLFDTNSSAQSVGGALFLDVNSATITDSTFTNNLSDRGGAIYASSGNITIQNSTIYDNFARETGGGIQLSTGMHLLQNVTVSDNFAEDGGGGILNSGNTKIINSTITENRARTTGAGIMSAFSSNILTTMTNTLVVDNTVAVGG
ncbi:MAG: right-handed parallel beta-helix repeat-containing protein, partial [Chloroflexota bacterium]